MCLSALLCNKILHVGLVLAMVTTENYAINALDGECNEWASVQHHEYCFDPSHATPTPWDKSGHMRWHSNDALLIIHPDKSASLPEPFSKEAFARKVRVDTRLEKPFPFDEECRSQNSSTANREFLRLGYSSTEVKFSPDQKALLKAFLDGVVGSTNTSTNMSTDAKNY